MGVVERGGEVRAGMRIVVLEAEGRREMGCV